MCALCSGAQRLSHWTARGVPSMCVKISVFTGTICVILDKIIIRVSVFPTYVKRTVL